MTSRTEEELTMPTDLRAALRAALQMAADALPLIPETSVRDAFARLVALADAPPTVAELLPMVDAGHNVHWEAPNLAGLRMRARMGARGELTIEMLPKICWVDSLIHPADLTAPGRLVEVSP